MEGALELHGSEDLSFSRDTKAGGPVSLPPVSANLSKNGGSRTCTLPTRSTARKSQAASRDRESATAPLTPEEQEELIESHKDRIDEIARMMYDPMRYPTIDHGQCFSEANFGLFRAAQRYRPGGLASFKTYASSVMRGRILELREREIERLENIRDLRREANHRLRDVETNRRIDDVAQFREAVSSETTKSREDEMIEQEEEGAQRPVEALMGTLNAREREVIESMYFNEDQPGDIAKRWCKTPQWVNTLHRSALEKMRKADADSIGREQPDSRGPMPIGSRTRGHSWPRRTLHSS